MADNNLALIVREPVVEACIDYGRTIEHEIRQDPEAELTDDRLEELCEPLLKRIKTDTEERVRSELEEDQARREDEEEDYQRERNILDRVSKVKENVIINIMKNGDIVRSITKRANAVYNLLDRKRVSDSVKRYRKRKATMDAEDASQILEHSSDDKYWDDCKTQIDIELQPPLEEFVGVNDLELLSLLEKHTTSIQEMLNLVNQIEILGVTEMYHFQFVAFRKLLKIALTKGSGCSSN